jgi:hypothetical protein
MPPPMPLLELLALTALEATPMPPPIPPLELLALTALAATPMPPFVMPLMCVANAFVCNATLQCPWKHAACWQSGAMAV